MPNPLQTLSPVFFLAAIFYLNFCARIIFAPLSPALEHTLPLSRAQTGQLFLLISSGYLCAMLLSGYVSARLRHRRTIAVSSIATGGALLLGACAHSAPMLLLSSLLTGFCAGLYLPSGITAITTRIPQHLWGRALAIHELAPNLAFTTAPLLAELFLQISSWRTALAVLAGCAMALGLFVWLRTSGGEHAGQPPSWPACMQLLRQPVFWGITALFALAITLTVGIYAMLPLYLVDAHGYSRTAANSLISVSRAGTLVTVFGGGFMADRLGSRRTISLIMVFSGLMTVLIGSLPTAAVGPAVILQPLLAVCFFPAGFAALARCAPEELRGVAVSLAVPVGFLAGGGIMPALIGLMADAGLFTTALTGTGAAALLGGLLAHAAGRRRLA